MGEPIKSIRYFYKFKSNFKLTFIVAYLHNYATNDGAKLYDAVKIDKGR